jgi:hypothetical protein
MSDVRADAKTLETARRMFLEENLKLVAALERLGTQRPADHPGDFAADYLLQKNKLGLVARITCVDERPLEAPSAPARSRSSGRMPSRPKRERGHCRRRAREGARAA